MILYFADTVRDEEEVRPWLFFEFIFSPPERRSEIGSHVEGRGRQILQPVYVDLKDLFFITDGICDLEDERKIAFIQAKSSSGARCFSVLIGSDATDTVKQFSDKVFSLPTTLTSRDGGQILSEI